MKDNIVRIKALGLQFATQLILILNHQQLACSLFYLYRKR